MFKDRKTAAWPFEICNLMLENVLLQNLIVLGAFVPILLVIILAHRSVRKDRSAVDEASAIPVFSHSNAPTTNKHTTTSSPERVSSSAKQEPD